MPISDEQLVDLIVKGEPRHFSELYDRYVTAIYRFIMVSVRHKETAEDITSTTFIKSFEKIATFKSSSGSFKSWLYTIARNTMTDHFRSSGREFPTDEIPDLPGNENIERDLDTAGAIKKIGQALEKLDEDLRQIIILRLWEELSFSEIGKVVGKSEGAVKMSFYRSIADLRNILVVFLIILAGQALADIGQVMIHIWKIK